MSEPVVPQTMMRKNSMVAVAPENRERYAPRTDNPVLATAENAVSTFSIDVDTGSYSNVRRMFAREGRLPPQDAVRSEEMINYFDYHYPLPRDGKPFAVHTQTVDSPWQRDAKLIRIGIQAADLNPAKRPPANLVFLIDTSGSMYDDDKRPLVQKTVCHFAEALCPDDSLALITYAGDTREGKSPSVRFPGILGIECVGEIVESTAAHLPVGARMVSLMGEMGRAFDGGHAEFVLLANTQIYLISSDLDWQTLAAIPETYYTALGSLTQLQISAQDRVLVRGASSGVGVAFAQLLKVRLPGITLHGSTRSLHKEDKLRAVGFDAVIADEENTLQTNESYHKILELIGARTLKNSLRHLHAQGIVCYTGQLGNLWYLQNFDPIMELANSAYLTAFYSGNVSQSRVDALFAYMARYRIPVLIEKIFKLNELPEAHGFLQSQAGFGKMVVVSDA